MDTDINLALMKQPFAATAPSEPAALVIHPKVDAWLPRQALQARPGPTAEALSVEGARWLRGMPVQVRPLITAKRHPHIVNRLAALWGRADALSSYLDSLMISARPARRGFAMEVLSELCDLQRALPDARRR